MLNVPLRTLFLLIACPLLADTAVAAPVGDLKIEVKTARRTYLLEPGKKIAVDIRIKDARGRPVEGLKPSVVASNGKTGEARDLGSGKYRASYRMPATKHPQIVILAAKLPASAPGWTVIYLTAKTDLPVKTDKPGVLVTLKLGDKSYGPVRTDKYGRVKIPVVVHPGQTEALAEAVDDFGNRNQRRVSIPVPNYSRLVGFAERRVLAADGLDSTDIWVIQVHADGTPVHDPAFVAYKSAGKIKKAVRIGAGLYRIRYTAPAGFEKGARLTIADKRNPEKSRKRFRFDLTTGRPEKLSIMARPQRLVADGNSQSAITLRVADRAGNPLSEHKPRVTCSAGKVSKVLAGKKGEFGASFTAPVYVEGPVKCMAELAGGRDEPLRTDIILQMSRPVPDKMDVEAENYELPADGQSQLTVGIVVRDRYDNPLPGVAVRAHTTVGKLSPVRDDGQGRYHTVYTAPEKKKTDRVRIQFHAGQGQDAPRSHVIIGLSEPPRVVEPLYDFLLSAQTGLITNLDPLVSVSFSLQAAVGLPFGADTLHLALEAGYRFGSREDFIGSTGASATTRLEVVPVHLLLVFKPWPRSALAPFVAVGGGAEFVHWSVRPASGWRESGRKIMAGALAILGAELRLGVGAVVFGVRYMYAYLEGGETLGGAGPSMNRNIGGIGLTMGYRLFF